jgi:uncharacterized ferredoxin-like protein
MERTWLQAQAQWKVVLVAPDALHVCLMLETVCKVEGCAPACKHSMATESISGPACQLMHVVLVACGSSCNACSLMAVTDTLELHHVTCPLQGAYGGAFGL